MPFPTFRAFSAIALLASTSFATATPPSYHHNTHNVCVDKVFQFATNGTQVENLAVRSNGNVLFTLSAPSAEVWQVDPSIGNSSATLIATTLQLSNSSSAAGITEVDHDFFAVVSCDPTLKAGTCKVHTLDFTTRSRLPKVTFIAAVPDAIFLNGLTTLSSKDRTVLASDSFRDPQAIYRINLKTGHNSVVLQDKSMEPPTNSTGVPIGINGLRRLGHYVYYTNSGTSTLWRVVIHPDGIAAGPFEQVANLSALQPFVDDFALHGDGTAFVTGSNEVTIVRPNGDVGILAGGLNQTMPLAGTTSAQFGRGRGDGDVLYVSSTGGAQSPVDGVFVEPGFVAGVRWGGGC